MQTLLIILIILIFIMLSLLSADFVFRKSRESKESKNIENLQKNIEEKLSSGLSHSLELQNNIINQLAKNAQIIEERLKSAQQTIEGRLLNQQELITQNQALSLKQMQNSNEIVGNIKERMGEIGKSTEQILLIGKDISELQNILRSPKLRGGMGEMSLSILLEQALPPQFFSTQYRFKSGSIVDAIIKLPSAIIPIDSKFPLESFKSIAEKSDEPSRMKEKKAFIRDIKVHIDSISGKYILPSEGTLDFALMYIPAENVYYEVIIREDNGDQGLFNYALSKRVIPVSPNTFYAYLQTIALGLKGLHIEERARDVLNSVLTIKQSLQDFQDIYDTVGKHLHNAEERYDDALRSIAKIHALLERASTIEIKSE